MLSVGQSSDPRLAANLPSHGGSQHQGQNMSMQPFNQFGGGGGFNPFISPAPMMSPGNSGFGGSAFGGSAFGGYGGMNMGMAPMDTAGSIAPGPLPPTFNPMGMASPNGGAGGSAFNFSMRSGSISSLGISNFGHHPLSANNSVFGGGSTFGDTAVTRGGGGARQVAGGLGAIPESATRNAQPAQPAPATQPTQRTTREAAPEPAKPGPGMDWIIKNNKLIVSGFHPGSAGREKGVKPGDILRKVNDVDVLKMGKDASGTHMAIPLLLGPPRSQVTLTFLRVQRPRPGEVASRTPLLEYTTTLPRVYLPGQKPPEELERAAQQQRPVQQQNSGCCMS